MGMFVVARILAVAPFNEVPFKIKEVAHVRGQDLPTNQKNLLVGLQVHPHSSRKVFVSCNKISSSKYLK